MQGDWGHPSMDANKSRDRHQSVTSIQTLVRTRHRLGSQAATRRSSERSQAATRQPLAIADLAARQGLDARASVWANCKHLYSFSGPYIISVYQSSTCIAESSTCMASRVRTCTVDRRRAVTWPSSIRHLTLSVTRLPCFTAVFHCRVWL